VSGAERELSVVIPTFRERERIATTLSEVLSHFGALGGALEVIVADDGSDDGTADAARAAADGRVKVLCPGEHSGKGAAVRRGVLASSGAKVLVTDADLAIPLGEYAALEGCLAAGADVVIGSKELGRRAGKVSQPPLRTLMGRVFNLAVRALVLPGILDTQAGFKLYRGDVGREIAEESRLNGFAHDVEMLALARLRGYTVEEAPVACRRAGKTSVRVLSDSIAMLVDIVRLRRRFGRIGGRRDGA